MRRAIVLLALVALAVTGFWFVAGCSRQPTSAAVGTIRLKMTDAPGDFDSVNVMVDQVSARIASSDDAAGSWEVLSDDDATYDLMSLRNGVFATLAIAQVPAGMYTHIRLRIGPGSRVVVNGVSHPLVIPSGTRSDCNLSGEFEVAAGTLLDLEIDFDAARSIVRTGAGTYALEPVVRVRPYGTSGAIAGTVSPPGTTADVFAIQGPDTVAATSADADGAFRVCVLPPGAYTLALRPEPGYRHKSLANIAVTAGVTTGIGTIALKPAE